MVAAAIKLWTKKSRGEFVSFVVYRWYMVFNGYLAWEAKGKRSLSLYDRTNLFGRQTRERGREGEGGEFELDLTSSSTCRVFPPLGNGRLIHLQLNYHAIARDGSANLVKGSNWDTSDFLKYLKLTYGDQLPANASSDLFWRFLPKKLSTPGSTRKKLVGPRC